MKRFLKIAVSVLLVTVIYFSIISPAVVAYMKGENIFVGILNNAGIEITEEGKLDFSGIINLGKGENGDAVIEDVEKFTNNSSSGNTTRFQKICSFDEDGYVWCTQKTSLLGFHSGCLLTSYSMLIINAGRHVGTEKNYDPVDVYLGNNYEYTTTPSNRRISAYHYVIAGAFNYSWKSYSIKGYTDSTKVNKLKDLLKDNPWGVVIGGSYTKSGGGTSTHYIVARLDKNGNLVFDDPAFSARSSGAKINDISKVWGINTWGNITSIMTITPNLDSNGVWKPGKWEKCLNDSNCHVCYKNQNC